jgi:hypothetical protein
VIFSRFFLHSQFSTQSLIDRETRQKSNPTPAANHYQLTTLILILLLHHEVAAAAVVAVCVN